MKQEELLETKDKELRSLRKSLDGQSNDPRLEQFEVTENRRFISGGISFFRIEVFRAIL